MPKRPKGLLPRQARFVRALVSGETATQAALGAYNCKTAASASATAHDVLANPRVQAAVAEALDAEGLTVQALAAYQARLVRLVDDPNPACKAIGQKALQTAWRLRGALQSTGSPAAATPPDVTVLALVLQELRDVTPPAIPVG